MPRPAFLSAIAVITALVAGPTAANAAGPVAPNTWFDGVIVQAGKRAAAAIGTSSSGRFDSYEPTTSLFYPRGMRCGRPGGRAGWRYLGRLANARIREAKITPDGRVSHRFLFRNRQTGGVVRGYLSGRVTEGGTLLRVRYREVRTRPGWRCDTGVIRAELSAVRYRGITEQGNEVGFTVTSRAGVVGLRDGTLGGTVPACMTDDPNRPPEIVHPQTDLRRTGLRGTLSSDGTAVLHTTPLWPPEGPPEAVAIMGAGPTMPNDLDSDSDDGRGTPGLPDDEELEYITSPARITFRIALSWHWRSGTDTPCRGTTRLTVTLRRAHPEHAARFPRPRLR